MRSSNAIWRRNARPRRNKSAARRERQRTFLFYSKTHSHRPTIQSTRMNRRLMDPSHLRTNASPRRDCHANATENTVPDRLGERFTQTNLAHQLEEYWIGNGTRHNQADHGQRVWIHRKTSAKGSLFSQHRRIRREFQ